MKKIAKILVAIVAMAILAGGMSACSDHYPVGPQGPTPEHNGGSN